MREEIVTSDLSQFGIRELKKAGELLLILKTKQDKTERLSEKVQVFMNKNSGYVFLSDEDYNVAMMNGDVLEDFLSCPECGHEGFASEFVYKAVTDCCLQHFIT